MFGGYIVLAAAALITALGVVFWPGKTLAFLLLFAPIIWAFGASDIHSQETGPNLAIAVSGVATLMYARFLVLPLTHPILKWLQIASLVYCLAVLPSVFVSASFTQSFRGYVRLISPMIIMFACLHCSRARGVAAVHFKAIALSTVCLFITVLLAQSAGEGSYAMGGFDRLRAFNLTPQHVSQYSVVAVAVLICGVLLGKYRYLYALGILTLTGCAYLTGFRTAWVGMSILIALVMLLAVRSGMEKFLTLLVGLGLLATGTIIVQSLARYARSDEAVSLDVLDTITSGRITTDSIALDRYLAGTPAEWLFGVGVYSSTEATYQGEGVGYIVHSDLLATLIECGVVGLLGYAFLLVTTGWILLRVRSYLPQQRAAWTFLTVAWCTFVAFTVMGIVGALYLNVFVAWYFYGFIGFAVAQLKRVDAGSGSATQSLDFAVDPPIVSAKAISPAPWNSDSSPHPHIS